MITFSFLRTVGVNGMCVHLANRVCLHRTTSPLTVPNFLRRDRSNADLLTESASVRVPFGEPNRRVTSGVIWRHAAVQLWFGPDREGSFLAWASINTRQRVLRRQMRDEQRRWPWWATVRERSGEATHPRADGRWPPVSQYVQGYRRSSRNGGPQECSTKLPEGAA